MSAIPKILLISKKPLPSPSLGSGCTAEHQARRISNKANVTFVLHYTCLGALQVNARKMVHVFFRDVGIVCLIYHHYLSDALQERHFLHYKFTVLTRADTFPEFSAEVVYDDRRISHFSDEERVWIGTEDWTEAPADPPDSRDWFIHQIRTLSNCTDSQCSELHVLQRIIGCELEKLPDGSVDLTVFDEYGFDGEDLISFNSDTMQWIEKSPKAKRTKEQWDSQTGRNQFLKYFLMNCTDWISTFINTKMSSPDVHMFASEAPGDQNKLVLTCLATGFYPRDVQMYIGLEGSIYEYQTSELRPDEDQTFQMNIRLDRNILENQTSEIRPNADQTFQMRTSVKIDRNHESYECFVNHSSLTEPASEYWKGKPQVISCFFTPRNGGLAAGGGAIATTAVVLIAPALTLTGIVCWYIIKMRRSDARRESTEENYNTTTQGRP